MQVVDHSDPSSRSSAETEEFAHFKRDIYQKVLGIVFKSVKRRSHNGDTHRCADNINRILYPDILIVSQDAEEGAYFCGCRAAGATHPCPKCLISHSELHDIFGKFKLRTSNNMQAALKQVSTATTKSEKQRILVKHGLHDISVCTITGCMCLAHINCSTSYGTSGFPIHIKRFRMIPYTLTI